MTEEWVPGFLHAFHDRPGKMQQTGIFCGKALLLTSSGARVQEREKEQEQEQECKREQESKKKNKKARERKRMAKPRPF